MLLSVEWFAYNDYAVEQRNRLLGCYTVVEWVDKSVYRVKIQTILVENLSLSHTKGFEDISPAVCFMLFIFL